MKFPFDPVPKSSVMARIMTPENLGFCKDFLNDKSIQKLIFGRNWLSKYIVNHLNFDGVIDEFTDEMSWHGLPIVNNLANVPKSALILNATGTIPFKVKRKLDKHGLRNLDHFSFYHITGLTVPPTLFNQGFEEDFVGNRSQYEWIYGLLSDEISRRTFESVINFRLSLDDSHFDHLTINPGDQYFEKFLFHNRFAGGGGGGITRRWLL
jgi:hypothetical protein